MRTYGVSTVLVLAFFLTPTLCEASSKLVWQVYTDEVTREVYPNYEVSIIDGSSTSVPFNVLGPARIVIDHPDFVGPFTRSNGSLYFIPDPNAPQPERVLLGDANKISWTRAGTYELDTYAYVIAPTAAPKNKFFAWLIPHAVAAPRGDYVDTIRFTLSEGPPLAPPCCSSVAFIPGMQGSVLKEGANTLWPPSIWSRDVARLALSNTGESLYPVVVAGVLESFYGESIYSGFTHFLDSLVGSPLAKVKEWKALAYDWRLSPDEIIANGVETEDGNVSLVDEIEALAAESNTGKVSIVAHSMGGLMGKAIIQELVNRGEENLVDDFIMVGVPQLGTPQGVAALLHGDDQALPGGYFLPGIIVNPSTAREVAQNMTSAYNLMPSAKYFTSVATPPITFNPSAVFTQAWINQWGPTINTYDEFRDFVTATNVSRTNPTTELNLPKILNTDRLQQTSDFHSTYDSFEFPSSIHVVQVAGWGVPTLKSIDYRTEHSIQNYEPQFTREGDKTVVYPSAVSSAANETYYFNLDLYRDPDNRQTQHRDLLNAAPLESLIRFVLTDENLGDANYITTTKPTVSNVLDQLVVSTHSPVILGATDDHGRYTGIIPNQDSTSGFLRVKEEIPGSSFTSVGADQYIFLPKVGSYSLSFKGSGTGPATVETATVTGDTVTTVASYSDMPVTPVTTGSFTVSAQEPQAAMIALDTNGDGVSDIVTTPDNYAPTIQQLLEILRARVDSLDIKPKLKTGLLNKIDKLEKKITKQKKARASMVVVNLSKQIIKKGAKGKISEIEVNEILALLDQIDQQL